MYNKAFVIQFLKKGANQNVRHPFFNSNENSYLSLYFKIIFVSFTPYISVSTPKCIS